MRCINAFPSGGRTGLVVDKVNYRCIVPIHLDSGGCGVNKIGENGIEADDQSSSLYSELHAPYKHHVE